MNRRNRPGCNIGDLALPILYGPCGRGRTHGDVSMNLNQRPLRAPARGRNSNRPVAVREPKDVDRVAAADESPAKAAATSAGRPSPTEAAEVRPVAAAIRSPAPSIARRPKVPD